MNIHSLATLLGEQQASAKPYLEFLRVRDLSAGIYVLPAGGVDLQQPHNEAEVYFVIRGQGRVLVAEEDREVSAGDVVYVPAKTVHRFHAITQEMVLLVFFAPAEGTSAGRS